VDGGALTAELRRLHDVCTEDRDRNIGKIEVEQDSGVHEKGACQELSDWRPACAEGSHHSAMRARASWKGPPTLRAKWQSGLTRIEPESAGRIGSLADELLIVHQHEFEIGAKEFESCRGTAVA
jgi:hypothetical protein